MGTNAPGEVLGHSDIHGTVRSLSAASGFHGLTGLAGVQPAGGWTKNPWGPTAIGPLHIYTAVWNLLQVLFPQRSAHLSSRKCRCLKTFPLCLDTLWMFACFTRWVTNGWTRLSYKRYVRTIFVFLATFYYVKCFDKKTNMFFFCSLSSDCDAGTLKENTEPVCLTVRMFGRKRKKKEHWILSSRDIQTRGFVSVGFLF